MLTAFFDIEGIVYKESIPAGQIINYTFCCDVLQWLLQNFCITLVTKGLVAVS